MRRYPCVLQRTTFVHFMDRFAGISMVLQSVTVLSPDCDIDMYSFALGGSSDTVIYGHIPSTVQLYAEDAQQTFRTLCDHSFTDGLCIHCGRPDTIIDPGSDGLIWEINNDLNNWEADVLYIDKHLIKAKASKTGVCEILNRAISIADDAFRDCNGLTSAIIPESITRIPPYAFENCSSLESVTVSDTVGIIEGSAFVGCISLKNVTIPEGVSAICSSTFAECSALEHITIPESVTEIAGSAFYGCSALRIPGSVVNIGGDAFGHCTGLENITFLEGVRYIRNDAFSGRAAGWI